MVQHRIFTVGFRLPGDDFEYFDFFSDQSLLDADIVLFRPTLRTTTYHENYNGRPLLSESDSFRVAESLRHWQTELVAAVNAGKLVIIYLAKPLECFRYTGEKTYSGTGRSRTATRQVTAISSYEAVPNLSSQIAKSGKEISPKKDIGYLAGYWKEFAAMCHYETLIEGKFSRVFLETKSGGKIVGAEIKSKGGGALLFLPPLHYETEDSNPFLKDFDDFDDLYDGESPHWTEDALVFGKKLIAEIAGIAEYLRSTDAVTPPPEWTGQSLYRLSEEGDIERSLEAIGKEISTLQSKKAEAEAQLKRSGLFRRLLYEKGHPLEEIVRKALTILGFEAQPFVDGQSEFDVVFTSPEGRFIGEVEGKDNRAIDIDKFSQLERNLHEDFAKEEVQEMAKGVLFGNGFRLTAPESRQSEFTTKCMEAAKRVKTALIRTRDLFEPVKYLRSRSDSDYAAQCRKAIFEAEGTIVVFPKPPNSDEKIVITEAMSGMK